MITSLFLKKCYVVTQFVSKEAWLQYIILHHDIIEKIYPGLKKVKSDSTEYLLESCRDINDAIFFLENYEIINSWVNVYVKKFVEQKKQGGRGTYTVKVEAVSIEKNNNIRFIQNCLSTVRDSYHYLKEIPPTVMNVFINSQINTDVLNIALTSVRYKNTDKIQYMKYILSSEKWDNIVFTDLFNKPDMKKYIEILIKLDMRESSLMHTFAMLDQDKIIKVLTMGMDDMDFFDLAEFVSLHMTAESSAYVIINMTEISNFKWFLHCLIWASRQQVNLVDFITYCYTVKFNKWLIDRAMKKIKQLDPLSAKTLFDLPTTYVTAWLLDRMDVFQAYYDLYHGETGQIHGRYCFTTVTIALIKKQKQFLGLLVKADLDMIQLEGLDNLYECCTEVMDKINLNELTPRLLMRITKIIKNKRIINYKTYLESSSFLAIIEERRLNPNELCMILEILSCKDKYNEKVWMLELFARLLLLIRSDDAIIRCRQMMNHCDADILKKKSPELFAVLLSKQDLPAWRMKMFRFPVTYDTVLLAMSVYEKIKDYIIDAENEIQARFAANHYQLCKNGLREGIKHFIEVDEDTIALKNLLELKPEFYKTYEKESNEFFLGGNASVALSYWLSIASTSLQDKFRVILKAAMSGKLKELRFYKNDLSKECSFIPSQRVKNEWETERAKEYQNDLLGKLLIYEDTSFNGIMKVGAIPFSTCLHYEEGGSNECLLSLFDANKRIIYISRKNGDIIGRAMLRLTKMTEQKTSVIPSKLDFTDVTIENNDVLYEEQNIIEIPVIFLERLYTGCQDNERVELENTVIQFAKVKADHAGITLVLSNDYSRAAYLSMSNGYQEFALKRVGIYITKSRSGKQYLDSLGGEKTNSDKKKSEDTYVYVKCYVKQEFTEAEAV